MRAIKCPRCCGIGTIREFKNVLAGSCFKCHGTGRLKATQSRQRFKFVIVLTNRVTGSRDSIYAIKAANSAQAIRMVGFAYQGASTTFKETYSMEGAAAVCEDELTNTAEAKEAPKVPGKNFPAERPINHRDLAEG